MKLHKDLGYNNIEHSYEWGNVKGKLLGQDMRLNDDVTVRKSPYEFLLWFSLNQQYSQQHCYVFLDSLEFSSVTNRKIIFYKENMKSQFYVGYGGVYTADFIFSSLNLEYEEYELRIKFHLSEKCINT